MTRSILILGTALSAEATALAESLGLSLIPSKSYPTPAELIEAANTVGAQGMIVRMGRVTAEIMDTVPTLRIIAKHGVGVDGIEVDAARARGIPVVVAGGANAQSVAEQALALLLGVARSTAWLDRRVRSGHWDKPNYAGYELMGKSIGLVGLGAIGRAFLELLAPFRMTVSLYDPFLPADAVPSGVTKVDSVDALLATSDILSLHCPLTDANRGMIDRAALGRMKASAILINTARGELVDQAALIDALRERTIFGAGLDTFSPEPPPADSPLWSLDTLVVSPHVGANTHEARVRVGISDVQQIADYLDRGRLDARNCVNLTGLKDRAAA
jgi:D-3-phosphoglycerate dehydrogenase